MSQSLETDAPRLDAVTAPTCELRASAAPPTDLRVRPATPADHAAIVALLRELELDYAARHLPSFLVLETCGAGGGREIVGIAELKDFGGLRLLSCVGVREDLQGTGLGRALVERALDGVAEDVWLYTLIPGFFERLGFRDDDAPPARLPPRRLYGCDACHPERCHRMVRRGTRGGAPTPEVLDEALAAAGEPTCDLSAASLWIWRDCEAPSVRTIAGNVCIRLDPHHEAPYFLEPLACDEGLEDGGVGVLAALDACLRETGRVSRVRAGLALRLPADRYDVVPLPDHFDYVCDVRALAELRGAKHDGQRNRIRRFAKDHPRHEVRALTAADRDAALALFDRWGLGREDGDVAPQPAALPGRACQRRAIERSFEDFDRLRLSGAALVEDGALLGFLAASRTRETAFAHFLYADAALPGAYQTLLVEACRTVLADATWINLEEDLGLPGLRRMKQSWQPARVVEKFEVRRR